MYALEETTGSPLVSLTHDTHAHALPIPFQRAILSDCCCLQVCCLASSCSRYEWDCSDVFMVQIKDGAPMFVDNEPSLRASAFEGFLPRSVPFANGRGRALEEASTRDCGETEPREAPLARRLEAALPAGRRGHFASPARDMN